jgi:methylglutaconyl-CoA hydratase
MLGALLEGGPRAQAEAKRLVADVTNKPLEPALLDETAKRIASVRASAEGREGITAFLEKRKPNWVK